VLGLLNTIHGMTNKKDTDRRLLQVSLKPDFYERVRQHCARIDLPMAIWVRQLIKREVPDD
jgi:hypothetical protein